MRPAILVFVAGCFGPSVQPAYQKDVEVTLAAHAPGARDIAPEPLRLQPWKPGQWALYRTSDHGKIGYEKLSVVAADDCGVWIEQVRQDAYHRSVSKICYRGTPTLSIADTMDLVQVLITQGDTGRPVVWDLRANPQAKQGMRMLVQSLVSVGWIGNEQLAREDVTVGAGRFLGAARYPATVNALFTTIEVTSMIHPAVPVWGIVRTTASTGVTSELVDFGQEGATSVLASSGER